jgi:hypothetical protein
MRRNYRAQSHGCREMLTLWLQWRLSVPCAAPKLRLDAIRRRDAVDEINGRQDAPLGPTRREHHFRTEHVVGRLQFSAWASAMALALNCLAQLSGANIHFQHASG